MTELKRLEPVPLRDIWKSEPTNFTPWLAEPENLSLLGETLGIELERKATEHSIGSFSADIVCVDTANDSNVVIENQLEDTDHLHAGQLLTYAAGLKATTVVWIAKKFRQEHASALKWLNDVTSSNVAFFGLEIELWRIGESAVAPKFNVVSGPDNWSRGPGPIINGPPDPFNVNYWTKLHDELASVDHGVRPVTPQPKTYAFYSIGKAKFRLRASFSKLKKQIQVSLLIWGPNAKAFGEMLRDMRDEIHAEVGSDLAWALPPALESTVISLTKTSVDPQDESDWHRQFSWFVMTLNKFNAVFRDRVKVLDLSNYVPNELDADDDPDD